ncbi:MAG: hypothetical protein M1401_14680 [Chloroflexi bacterium]|nr:hypothetical protein [Chloroflexota bacterium]MCL5110075.1 hypothetical protein [Chloroflexota bacterium]
MRSWKRFDPPRVWTLADPYGKSFEAELFWDSSSGYGPGSPAQGLRLAVYEEGERVFLVEGWSMENPQGLAEQLREQAQRRIEESDWAPEGEYSV